MVSGQYWHVIDEIDLVGLIADHARLRVLCDRLEACADALPDRVSESETDALGRSLCAMMVRNPRPGTAAIDALFACDLDDPLTAALLRRMRAWHLRASIHADDIAAALSGDATPCAEAFGYMLRGFFDGCRREMDFTELVILALGADRLSRNARAMLVDGLCGRDAG
ncbi:MAG: hypothetical protein DI640_03765 [Sphingomonas taxi]|uniref:Uncharacterized protein n=1 Tax=Sphingomonas taxi TaxID=1549858 RepID=A0A2W5B5B2_9SPHN|nr:MAG: hypothetical protein DI640_03765 [Sphingomonas taxi]